MMSWIADEYQKLHPSEINARGCVTGNPYISEVEGRVEATGRGVQFGLRELGSRRMFSKQVWMDLLMENPSSFKA